MKKLFKWAFRLVILIFALVAIVVLFRNPILRTLAEHQIRKETGMETVLGRVRIDLRSPLVRFDNVRLISPPEFGGRLFLDLPEVRVEYDSVAVLFRRLRLRRLVFRLDEIRLVRTAQGRTNLQLLREQLARAQLGARLARYSWQYDGTENVIFAVGRLKYIDAREPAKSEEVHVGVHNVTIRPLRSAEEILLTLAKLAESRGAIWTADALAPGLTRQAGTVRSR
jgi:uncharacterized protein involved in outer membrane biogenesis